MNKPVSPPTLPFIDLQAQRQRLGPAVEEAILAVVRGGSYILGPEVGELEEALSAFCGAAHTVSCSDGTDALALVMMARGVGPGKAVLCPSFTYTATAEAIVRLGATPVFADVEERFFGLDVASLESALATARRLGLDPVGVIAVDLFGHPADYAAISPFCETNGLWLVSDAAQSFGARSGDTMLGRFGLATTTSFFPAKPLGCYGDGGAIFTDDAGLAAELRSLRFHGLSPDRSDHTGIGLTGRLDTIQAAVLLQKLKIFPDEIRARNEIADRYAAALSDVAIVPGIDRDCTSVWAQYTIRVRPEQRAPLIAGLKDRGIPTAVYYAKPMHRLTAYGSFPVAGNGLPVTERLSSEVLALPMHAYLDGETQARIVDSVRAVLADL